MLAYPCKNVSMVTMHASKSPLNKPVQTVWLVGGGGVTFY